jgi:hypothetical protein
VDPGRELRTPWEAPLIAMVVVVSSLFAFLLYLFLLQRRQREDLLEEMMPKKVIKYLAMGKEYAEAFDGVSILFAGEMGRGWRGAEGGDVLRLVPPLFIYTVSSFTFLLPAQTLSFFLTNVYAALPLLSSANILFFL